MRRSFKGLGVLLFASACVSTTNDTTTHGRILFDSDRTGTDEIFVIDPHGSNLRQLTPRESQRSFGSGAGLVA